MRFEVTSKMFSQAGKIESEMTSPVRVLCITDVSLVPSAIAPFALSLVRLSLIYLSAYLFAWLTVRSPVCRIWLTGCCSSFLSLLCQILE